MKSVLQDWVMALELRKQGVLVLALRGPDGMEKEHPAKNMVRALRGCIMVTGATGTPLMLGESIPDDSFMSMYLISHGNPDVWNAELRKYFSGWDSYNNHFADHFAHAAAICGMHYPFPIERTRWWKFYEACCYKRHCLPETPAMLSERLKDGPKPDDDVVPTRHRSQPMVGSDQSRGPLGIC